MSQHQILLDLTRLLQCDQRYDSTFFRITYAILKILHSSATFCKPKLPECREFSNGTPYMQGFSYPLRSESVASQPPPKRQWAAEG